MALVLAETAAGGAALLLLTPLWSEVKRGFFLLTGGVVAALAALSAAAAAVGVDRKLTSAGPLAVELAVAMAATTVTWVLLMLTRFRTAARLVGVVSVPLSAAMLFSFARLSPDSVPLSFLQLLAGAALTGAVLDGLLLGHWYLTDRKLPRGPINRMSWILVGAVVVESVALAAGGFGADSGPGKGSSGSLSPLLAVGGSAAFIALGLVACTGLIALFIKLTLRGSRPAAVQSATGFFYLAVLTAFTGEMAAKLRFLP